MFFATIYIGAFSSFTEESEQKGKNAEKLCGIADDGRCVNSHSTHLKAHKNTWGSHVEFLQVHFEIRLGIWVIKLIWFIPCAFLVRTGDN